ncbi:FAD-dependent thymidylate synthase [Limnoraphis robusta Tam1]|uniref:FAD-dependent thymidylate synthase n=1 Tax=Limnoraphis robusta CCNP1315 TaxID=3110306 RepID=A0ABU5U124_9CYAN|nr:FAD-dependent thymidylate synthase [Limnoraphis robusta]MEA5495590.1 FAD-dependent thymidylate synthase [Limnoraphis robusta BA-68 BA1]MEA5520884.1 FAD-dependent thymidylate synthase [Limnoraphis robusta CCNP1315]MEA5538138.1 FAD-dependent thymidylate synthase [Limnoraphis robusta Tam1]MEA5545878.1 FAD-dependent thymidylate synthase [Limnoraphis robusta CCNP1324]
MDKFRVEVIAQTPNPQTVIYAAMHQDYSDQFIIDERDQWPSETKCGEIIVKRLLAGDRGHYGPLEHVQIVLNCGYFPHSVMQQARTHRVGISFDVQSFRYTGQQFLEVLEGKKDLEDVFYLRPVGDYTNRQGKKYYYSLEQRQADLDWCLEAVKRYQIDFENGMSEEHARGKLPFDYRQHFVVSLNLRTLLHFLDLRYKKDAQLEIQKLCELMWPHLETWAPEVAAWYKTTRMGKARLSP